MESKVNLTIVYGDQIFTYTVEKDTYVENLKSSIEAESGIPSVQQILRFRQQILEDRVKLLEYEMHSDEMVELVKMPPFNPSQPLAGIDMKTIDAAELQGIMRSYKPLWNYVKNNPDLLKAVVHPDHSIMEVFLAEVQGRRPQLFVGAHPPLQPHDIEMRKRYIDNPEDEEAKKYMDEVKRMKEVRENLYNAMEYAPESFGNIVMLYINCEVNGHPLKAFVDSGAQMSVMSKKCAEQCGIIRLMDPNWGGVARGVGSAKILGRVHLTQLRIGKSFFNLPITILDQDDLDFLLGLNFLRSHQCTIDLKENVLRIGDEVTSFLPESELPKNALRGEELPTTPQTPNVVNPFDRAHAQHQQHAQQQHAQQPAQQHSQSIAQQVQHVEPTEENIATLTEMGVDRETAIALLRQTNNNVQLAASLLFDMS